MSEPQSINDPHLGTITQIAINRAKSIGGEEGAILEQHIKQCAVTVQGYINALHDAKNAMMALQKQNDDLKKADQEG